MSMVRRASLPNANNNGPRREGLRTKTPSVNDLSKKFKNAPRGKRRLEFQPKQPLKDKKFYLDLHGYKKIPSLAARIKELGGKVEEFFNKDIAYLITNRKDADSRLSPRSNSTPSPGMSVPSPSPINKSSSIKGSAWASPLSADSPQSVDAHQAAPKLDTRGRTLQKQATLMSTTKFGTSNVLTNAKAWGISVVHVDKVLEKLAEYGPSKAQKQPSIKELRCGKKELRVEIRKLQAPFIKVEDQSRHYQPLVKEFKEWPLPNFDTPVGTCPFDPPKTKKESEPKRKNKEKDYHNQVVKKQNKKGYCECCCLHYDALDLHIKSDHHKAFAQTDSNYDSLDKLISQGPNLQVFLDKVKQKYSRSETTKPASKNKVDDPFHTPTKEPVNSMDDTIDKEMNENIIENPIADREDVNERKADNLHTRRSNEVKENSQAQETMEQEGSEPWPRRRITRNHSPVEDSVRSENMDDPKIKPNSQDLSIKQETSGDHLRHSDCENENVKIIVNNAEVLHQKAASPDQSEMSEKKVDEQDEDDSQEALSSQEPAAPVSFASIKLHKTEDCDEDEGNRRELRSQRKSNCSSDSTGKDDVPKASRGQRKNSNCIDSNDNEESSRELRSRRKVSCSIDGIDGDKNEGICRELRSRWKVNCSTDSIDGDKSKGSSRELRSRRKVNCSTDSIDGDKNEGSSRELRSRRKVNCSTDSIDGNKNEESSRELRSRRKVNCSTDSIDGDKNEESSRELRSRRMNRDSESTNGDENDVPKRVLRGQRKAICSSDSTESLTNQEGMTLPSAKRNFKSSNVSSTDSLSERGNTTDGSQDVDRGTRAKDGSKTRKRNGITIGNCSEIHTRVKEKENFSSPKSDLSGSKRRDSAGSETLSSHDEDDDSDCSTEVKAGSRLAIPKLVIPRSIWSRLPENNSRKENHDESPPESRNEALKEHANGETGEQDLDEIVQMNDDVFTALFDSDNDNDDKSFDGFDVPHFEGSKSSEEDLTYHIKKIVEYYTESQDDTLVNTTNEEVDDEDQEERSGPTDSTVKQRKKKKRKPHGIKIILSSKTDDGDDNVFEDDEDDDNDSDDEDDDEDDNNDSDDEEEDSNYDDSNSTVADSTDGEDDELLSSSALCMDFFTYKRKSWNLDDGDKDFQVPPKRRRTTTDEDSTTHFANDRERAGDQIDSHESKRTTRASTRLSSAKETSVSHKNDNINVEDNSVDIGITEARRNARTSTRLSSTKEKATDNKRNGHAVMDSSNRETRRNARASTRTSKSNKKMTYHESDDEDVAMEDVSQREFSQNKGRRTRASSRNSNFVDRSADANKENCAANMEGESVKDRSKNTTRAMKMSIAEEMKIDPNGFSLVKENENKETRRTTRSSERASPLKESISDDSEDVGGNDDCRRKTRFSKRVSCTKESISVDIEDVCGNVEYRRKTRASKSFSSGKEMEVDHIKEHSVNDDPCPKRVTRSQGETGGDPIKRSDHTKAKNNTTSEKKENSKQRTSGNEVSSSKSKTNDVANESLSSSVFGDISSTDSSAFFKDLPQEVLDCLSVYMTIEERVKLRTRNKINSEPLPVRRNTSEKRKEDLKEKRDIQVIIAESKTAPNNKDKSKTEPTNVAEVSNTPRLRSRSLNQDAGNSKNLTKSRSVGGPSLASPPQRKPVCSASSSRDTSPLTTPFRTDKHWIFKPGNFSSSTPQTLRKVKSRASPKTEDKLVTTRTLRNANKCLMAGDSYEFMDEDVYAFDD